MSDKTPSSDPADSTSTKSSEIPDIPTTENTETTTDPSSDVRVQKDPLTPVTKYSGDGIVLQLVDTLPVTFSQPKFERIKPSVGEDLHVLGTTITSGFFTRHLQDKFDDIREIRFNPIWADSGPRKVKHPPKVYSTEEDDHGPIKNLLVSGISAERLHNLKALKHRISSETSICIVDEGIGLPEILNETVFTNPDTRPKYILGQVDHRLMWDREHPERLKRMRTRLTTSLSTLNYEPDHRQLHEHNYLVASIKNSPELQAIVPPYDRWLYYKLGNLLFNAVVEPVCVVLDCSYNQLATNTWGRRMLNVLMTEMELIIANLPELRSSHVRTLLLQNKNMHKMTFSRLINRKGATSKTVLQVRRGLPTDIDFINGYFVRRARQLGIDCPANEFAVSIVKAKHYHLKRLAENVIPFEVTSQLNLEED